MNYIKVERTDDNIVKAITASALRCVTLRRPDDITRSDILLPIDDKRAKLWNEHIESKLKDAEKEKQTRDKKTTIATEKAKKAAKQTGRHSFLANPCQYGYRASKSPDVSCMKVVQVHTERLRKKLGTSYENGRIPGLYEKIRIEILNECNSPAERKAYKRDAFQNLAGAHDAFMEDERGPWKCFRKALLDDYYEYADSDALPDQADMNRNVVAFFRRQDGIINLGIRAERLFLEAASLRDKYLYDMLPDFIRWDILSNWKLYKAVERENEDVAAGKDDEQPVQGGSKPQNRIIESAIQEAVYRKKNSNKAKIFLKMYSDIYRHNSKITNSDAIKEIHPEEHNIFISDRTFAKWISDYKEALKRLDAVQK